MATFVRLPTSVCMSVSKSTERDGSSPIVPDRKLHDGDNNDKKASIGIGNPWFSKYEVPRKLLHSSIGIATLVFYRYGASGSQVIRYMLPSLAIVLSADVLRFNSPSFARFYESVLGPFMRPSERHGWNGVIFYMSGVLCSLYFLPEDIATLSIVLLSWCDTAASTFGRAYGQKGPHLRKGKSLVGTTAACVTGSFATWLFYGYVHPLRHNAQGVWNVDAQLSLGWLSLAGGVIAAFSEFVDIWALDDNLVIPVLSGGLLWTLLVGFGFGR